MGIDGHDSGGRLKSIRRSETLIEGQELVNARDLSAAFVGAGPLDLRDDGAATGEVDFFRSWPGDFGVVIEVDDVDGPVKFTLFVRDAKGELGFFTFFGLLFDLQGDFHADPCSIFAFGGLHFGEVQRGVAEEFCRFWGDNHRADDCRDARVRH